MSVDDITIYIDPYHIIYNKDTNNIKVIYDLYGMCIIDIICYSLYSLYNGHIRRNIGR